MKYHYYRVSVEVGKAGSTERLALFERWDSKASRWRIMSKHDGFSVIGQAAAGRVGDVFLNALLGMPQCWSGRVELEIPHD